MRHLKRTGTVFALAGILTLSPAMTRTVDARTSDATTSVATVGEVCGALSDAIVFLEGRPPSRLRDFLLAQARRLFSKYCS
jgi:hypothetical protein